MPPTSLIQPGVMTKENTSRMCDRRNHYVLNKHPTADVGLAARTAGVAGGSRSKGPAGRARAGRIALARETAAGTAAETAPGTAPGKALAAQSRGWARERGRHRPEPPHTIALRMESEVK